MKIRGFTLVELLAVIVILSLLTLLVGTSVTKLLSGSKDDISEIQLGEIKEAAQTWSMDNLNKLPSSGKCKFITLKDLKEYGLLDSSIKDSKNNQELSNDLKIKITTKEGKDGNLITDYEVNPNNTDGCGYVYSCLPATESNKTIAGTVPAGNFALGDEYICNVDGEHKYHFYVLSTEEDKVNLIMSRNICSDGTLATETNKCLVAWVSKIDYNDDANYGDVGNNNKGPITAMNAIYSATKRWSNIGNIELNYTDEGNTGSYGYGGIKTTGNITKITMKDGTETARYENLKARIPKYLELMSSGCSNSLESLGNCPVWIVNGMNANTDHYLPGIREEISGIYGYWSLSSYDSSNYAWNIDFAGFNYHTRVDDFYYFGIRPVITVTKFDLL